MARFRFHRGSLAYSKVTAIEVGGLQELIDYYNSKGHIDHTYLELKKLKTLIERELK